MEPSYTPAPVSARLPPVTPDIIEGLAEAIKDYKDMSGLRQVSYDEYSNRYDGPEPIYTEELSGYYTTYWKWSSGGIYVSRKLTEDQLNYLDKIIRANHEEHADGIMKRLRTDRLYVVDDALEGYY